MAGRAGDPNRYTVRPTGRAATRLRAAVDHLIGEGIAANESAAVTLIIVRGLDAYDRELAGTAADRPESTDS